MRIALIIILSSILSSIYAQHEPINTQYIYHGLLVNSGIAGSRDALVATASYRDQWLGDSNTPRSLLFSAHAPLKNEKLAVGVQFYHDRVRFLTQTGVASHFAYRLKLKKGTLSFGTKLGVYSLSSNLQGISVVDPEDPEFSQTIDRFFSLGIGFGLYYKTENFYLGIAIPETINRNDGVASITSLNNWSSSFITGYSFDLNNRVKLIPNLLLRKIGPLKVQTDITAIVRLDKKYDIGGFVRSGDIIGGLFDLLVTDQLRVGYTFAFGLNDKNFDSLGNHEIALTFEFKKYVNETNTKFF